MTSKRSSNPPQSGGRSAKTASTAASRTAASRARTTALLAAVTLLLAGCFNTDPKPFPTSTPSPTPTGPPEFSQTFYGPITGEPAQITVSDKTTGKELAAGNIGVSFEAIELADPRWDPDVSNLDELLLRLGTPALRFGGNRLDRSLFWTSTGEDAPAGQTRVTPGHLQNLAKTVKNTGSQVTIGVPLGANDPERAADMAAHAYDILGENLVGVSVGNEPNGYTVDTGDLKIRDAGWDPAAYRTQLSAHVRAITKRNPNIPIIGPGAYDAEWMDAFTDQLTHDGLKDNVSALSQHWYALYDCDSTAVPGRGPEWQNFLVPETKTAAKSMLGIGLDRADAAGLPLWVEETGPTSCPGTNDTSRTVAESLWTADYTLHAATLGVRCMAMHSMLGSCNGAPMSLLCDSGQDAGSGAGAGAGLNPADWADEENGEYRFSLRHSFYALEVLNPAVGGDFLQVKQSGGGNLQTYSLHSADDEQITTVLINSNDAANSGGNPVSLTVPTGYVAVTAGQLASDGNGETEALYTPHRALPAEVPFTDPEATPAPSGSAAASGAGQDSAAGTSATGKDGSLKLDVAASAVTVIVFQRVPETTASPTGNTDPPASADPHR